MIPYGKQDISQSDIDAVVDVLRSDFLTQGSKVPEFEKSVSNYCNAKHAVATNSATSALHIACLSLGVKKGSLVWVPAISFVASSNCALYCGSNVDFIDIEVKTINISPSILKEKLEKNKSNGLALPDVVIAVHMAGQSCDMKEIFNLSKEYGFSIIEDASHSIGGKYKGELIGGCQYSDITIFSFHPVKIITTGEGGMAVTNSKVLSRKMNLYRSHGVTKDSTSMVSVSEGPWYYEQIELGFNYRMTEMQAALGISQLKNIGKFIAERTDICNEYNKYITNIKGKLPVRDTLSDSSWHLYIIQLNEGVLDRGAVFNKLREKGVGVNVHYRPIYLNPYYKSLGFKKGICPAAEIYYENCISIPLHHGMTESEKNYVIKTVNEVCS